MNAPDRTAWLETRRAGIGASDIAAVLGISPWKTPLQLYLEKRGELPPQKDTPQLRRGRMLEPLVLTFYEDETGHPVARHQEHVVIDGWKMATLDGFDEIAEAPVEAKTVNAFAAREFGAAWTDDVPLHYAAQVHWQMHITGTDVGYLAALIGSDDFRIFELRRDKELEQMLLARAEEFWRRVQRGQPPEPVSETDVRLLYPKDAGSRIEATDEITAKLEELRTAKQGVKLLEQHADSLAKDIKAFMGEAAELVAPDGRVLATWKTAKASERIDWQEAFRHLQFIAGLDDAEAAKAIEASKTTTAGVRRFLLKGE